MSQLRPRDLKTLDLSPRPATMNTALPLTILYRSSVQHQVFIQHPLIDHYLPHFSVHEPHLTSYRVSMHDSRRCLVTGKLENLEVSHIVPRGSRRSGTVVLWYLTWNTTLTPPQLSLYEYHLGCTWQTLMLTVDET
jgi:hypothetical protein